MKTYKVTHLTRYEYEFPVLHAQHVAHLRPRGLARQRVDDFGITVAPAPVWRSSVEDYFGNVTDSMEIGQVHDQFEVVTRSRVAVQAPDQETLHFSGAPGWDVWAGELAADRQYVSVREFVFDSPLVRVERALLAYASEIFTPGRPVLEAVLELNRRVHADLVYDQAVTDASTALSQVLRERRGVCQDFAHFAIGCLRSVGLPARYVSGYLESRPPPGHERLIGADASHAWFSVFVPEAGWLDLDPTNDVVVGDRHVTLGWGRDFGDVSPLRGVVHGGGGQRILVEVDVEPT